MTNEMTAEEAVKILRFEQEQVEHRLDGCSDTQENRNIYEAFSMAIKALEQQPCEDCISREAVIKNIKGWFDKIELNPDILIDSIVTLPSVTPSYNSIKTELKPCEDCVNRSELQKTMDSLPLFRFVNNDHEEADDYYNCESVDMVIRNLPSVTPRRDLAETSQDCISRQAVIRLVEQYPNIIGNRCSGLISDIKHLPSVIPQYTDEEIDKAQAVEQAYVDKMVELAVEESRQKWLESFDTSSATKCFEAVNLLKERLKNE